MEATASPGAGIGEPLTTVEPEVPTIEAIYALLAQTLADEQGILHSTITTTVDAEMSSYSGTVEQWVDAARNVVRSTTTINMTEAQVHSRFDVTRIMTHNGNHAVYREPDQRMDVSPPQTCFAATVAVAAVLECPRSPESSTTTVAHGKRSGRSALILVTEGEIHGSDETETFIERLYLDAETALPIAQETDGMLGNPPSSPFTAQITWQHEFIAQDAVPADFFDVSALAEEQLDALPEELPVYWFGAQFAPMPASAPLELSTAGTPDPELAEDTYMVDGAYDVLLTYRMADAVPPPVGESWSTVIVKQWSRATWNAAMAANHAARWAAQTCREQVDVPIDGGSATIFLGIGDPAASYETPVPVAPVDCAEQELTRIEAVVTLDDAVLLISVPGDSPYHSQAGMELLVAGLQQR